MGLQHFEVLPPVFSPVRTKSGIVWKRCRKNSSEKDVTTNCISQHLSKHHDSTKSNIALLKWSSAGAAFVEVKYRMNLLENVWKCAPKRPSLLLFTGNYPSLSLPPFRALWISRTLGGATVTLGSLRCDSVPTRGLSCDRSHGEVLIPIQGAQLSDVSKASIDPMVRWGFQTDLDLLQVTPVASNLDPSKSQKDPSWISVMPWCELNKLDQLIIQVGRLHHVRFQTI